MTRKDFELIASAIADSAADQNAAGRYTAETGAHDVAIVLSRRLTETNPSFNAKRFLIACGLPLNCPAVLDA
jgi:hypothetical protein